MRNQDLAYQLKTLIESGHYPPGARLPSARLLALEYQTSRLTASRALDRLEEERVVRRVPRSGSFVSDAKKPFTVGFADACFNHPSLELAAGHLRRLILDEFRKHNCKVRMLGDRDLHDPDWLGELDLLLVAHAVDRQLRKDLEKLKIPVLCFRSETVREELPFHQITIDLAPGFGELFRQLAPERFSRLFILTEGHELSHLRRDMALRFAREQGFPDIECIDTDGNDHTRFRELAKRCRGGFLFTCGDMLAAGLIGTLLAEGIAVGKDVMLAGYDNLESCGYLPFGKPVITAVGYDRATAAKAIAQLALRLMKEPESAALRTIVSIPAHTVFRQTLTKDLNP